MTQSPAPSTRCMLVQHLLVPNRDLRSNTVTSFLPTETWDGWVNMGPFSRHVGWVGPVINLMLQLVIRVMWRKRTVVRFMCAGDACFTLNLTILQVSRTTDSLSRFHKIECSNRCRCAHCPKMFAEISCHYPILPLGLRKVPARLTDVCAWSFLDVRGL